MEADTRYILRWAKKIMAIKLLGGRCKKCKTGDIFVLEFHHIDRGEKEFEIQDIRAKQWGSMRKEIEKCQLLCRNCHSESHHGSVVKRTKEELLKIKGVYSCSVCGYDKCHSSLDFHHRKGVNKKFNLAHIKIYDIFWDKKGRKNRTRILEELKKCDVVCKNCHKKLSYVDINRFKRLEKEIYEKISTYNEVKKPEQNRPKQIKEKNSSFRTKLAHWLRVWKKYGSTVLAAKEIGMNVATLSSQLSYSKWYKDRAPIKLAKRRNASSKYFGVYKLKNGGWQAEIKIENKTNRLGVYKKEIDAAKKVDRWYIYYYKNQKRTNFEYSRKEFVKMVNSK